MRELYYITRPEVQINPTIPLEDWELSEIGRQRALNIAELPFWKDTDLLLTSNEMRSIQTADIIATKTGLKITTRDCLREFDRSSSGFLEYKKYIENMNKFYDEPDNSIDGWETAAAVTKRVVDCLGEYFDDEKYKRIAVVAQGAVGALYKCHILGKKPSFKEDPKGQGKYLVIDIESKSLISDWQDY